jgi:hypothetical protein
MEYRQRVEQDSPLEKLKEKEGHYPKNYWENEVFWNDFTIYSSLLGLTLDLAKSKKEISSEKLNKLIDLAAQMQPDNNGELLMDFFKYQLSNIKNTGDCPDIHKMYKDHFVLSNFTTQYTKIEDRMLNTNRFRGTASKYYPNYYFGFYFERSVEGKETVGIYKECEQQVFEGYSNKLKSDYTFDPDSSYCFVYFD